MRSETQVHLNSERFTVPSRAIIEDAAATDILVRESWAHFCEVFEAEAHEAVTRLGFVMIKPDGLVSGVLGPTRCFLEKHGLEVIGVTGLSLSPSAIRLLWRNDWLNYSVDRLAFSDYLYTAGPAAILLVKNMTDIGTPCSNRLARIKGPANPKNRSNGDLRSVLGSSSSVINFVHTPDSCIEMLLELSVLLDRKRRSKLLRCRSGEELDKALAQVDRQAGRHKFLLHESLERAGLQDSLGPVLRQKRKLALKEIARLVDNSPERCGPWDFVTIALNAIELDWLREPANTIATFEIVCEAAGVEVPPEFENGARQSHTDLQKLRAHIKPPGLHDEPAVMFRARNTSGIED